MNVGCPGDGEERCFYPAAQCPFHAPRTAPRLPLPIPPERRGDSLVHRLGASVLENVAALHVDPLQASRVVRMLTAYHQLGPEPLDDDRALAEVELRGVVMSGFAPRNTEEWQLAREVFDDEAIEMFTRMVRKGESWEAMPVPGFIPPLTQEQLPRSLRGKGTSVPVHIIDRPTGERLEFYAWDGEPPPDIEFE